LSGLLLLHCSVADLGLAWTQPLVLGQGNLAICYQGDIGGVPVEVKVPKYEWVRKCASAEAAIQQEAAAYQCLASLQVWVIAF
jgi:hypothetical protein